jgi:hypothetical protein
MMEPPFPSKRLTRQEIDRAAIDLGAKFRTVQQWRYRGVPARWQLKLIKHFGAMIVIDDVIWQETADHICVFLG